MGVVVCNEASGPLSGRGDEPPRSGNEAHRVGVFQVSKILALDSPADLLVDKPMLSTPGPVVPTSPPRCSTTVLKDPTVQTIFLNLDFPTPAKEWGGVFDVWICGDAQAFAEMVHEELRKEEGAKDAAKERKRKREEATDGDAKSGEERSSRRRQG